MKTNTWLLLAALLATGACARKEASPADLFKQGMNLKNDGDYPAAIAQFSLALAAAPDDPSILNTRGTTLMIMGQHEAALKDFNRAVSLKPDFAQAIKNRGRTHFYLGHYADAAADLRRGSELDPGNLYVAIWLAIALDRQGLNGAGELAAGMARADSAAWPMPIAKYLSGKLTVDQLDAAASAGESGRSRTTYCTMFYEAEAMLARHDTTRARAGFAEARDTCSHTATEYHASVGELRQIDASR